MSPRKSVLETASTRARILDRALSMAVSQGLEGLTIGTLATDLGMSKAGVIGHFGTKEALQLAVVDTAVERFAQRVPGRAAGTPGGVPRLLAVHREWFAYMTEDHAGCFLTAAATEFDGRPGAVRDAVLAALTAWRDYLSAQLDRAAADGLLPAGADREQLLFELSGAALATGQAVQLHHSPDAAARGMRTVERVLGV